MFLITLGVILTADAAAAHLGSSLTAGIWFTYIAGILILSAGIFLYHIPKAILYIFLAAVVVVAVYVCAIYIYGGIDTVTYNEDAVIVLGAGIRGEEIPRGLKCRLDAAVDYHASNPDAVIVVSGGQGEGEDISESLAMERYLIAAGVPADKIIKESASTSTSENFKYSKALLDEYFDRPYSAAFISNGYHILRAEFVAEASGFDSISHLHAKTPLSVLIPNGLREGAGVIVQWMFL